MHHHPVICLLTQPPDIPLRNSKYLCTHQSATWLQKMLEAVLDCRPCSHLPGKGAEMLLWGQLHRAFQSREHRALTAMVTRLLPPSVCHPVLQLPPSLWDICLSVLCHCQNTCCSEEPTRCKPLTKQKPPLWFLVEQPLIHLMCC